MPTSENVGVTGFEPATSWSQTRRSTKLSYTPDGVRTAGAYYARATVRRQEVPPFPVLQCGAMPDKTPSIRYYLRVYENSFLNEPALHFESDQPFGTFTVGDHLDPKGLFVGDRYPFEGSDKWLKIKAVVHRLWQGKEPPLNHQIGLCVEPVPRLDDPNPPQWTSC